MTGVALAVAVAAAVAGPATAEEQTFDALLAEAEVAQQAGDLDTALARYLTALERRPEWAQGHWHAATLLYDLDRHEEARDQFADYLAVEPEDALALALKGLCESRLGAYQTAVDDLQKALALGVPNVAVENLAWLQNALLVNRLGQHDLALDLLRPFATEGKDQIPVIQAFGLALLRLPLLPEDVPEVKQDMILLAGRGGYHMARSRRTAIGRLALEELVSRYPAEPNVHYAFGVYLQPEEPDRAAREFERELELHPESHIATLQLSSMELRRGNAERALEVARRAYDLEPESPASLLVLGRALLETGEGERAVELLEEGAAMAPESPDFAFALAKAYRRTGRREDAAQADERFRRLKQALEERKASGGGPS